MMVSQKQNRASPHKPGRQQGVIMILMLWVLMALTIIVFSMANEVRTEAMATRNSKLMTQAYYNARAGISETIYKLLKSRQGRFAGPLPLPGGVVPDMDPTDIELGLVTVELPTGKSVCEVEDEAGKINVNNAGNHAMLRNLMAQIGIDRREGDAIVDSILDFVTPAPHSAATASLQQSRRMHGAGDEYYMRLSPPYRTKKRAFEVAEELLMVKGITPEIFYGKRIMQPDGQSAELYGLVKYVTVHQTFGTAINVNSAAIPVLLSVPGITLRKATELYERRKTRPFRNVQELQPPMEAQGRLTVAQSQIYSIRAVGLISGMEIKRVIRATVNLAAGQERMRHRMVYWNENAIY